MKLPNLKLLNQRGALHLAAPLLVLLLVAVVGTGMLVYNRTGDSNNASSALTSTDQLGAVATETTGATGGAKADVKNAPTGYLLVYSSQGKYSHAAVYVVGDAGDKKCGSKKFSKGPVVVSIGKKKPAKIKCTAGQTYNVFFLKKGQTVKKTDLSKIAYASTGLSTDHCSFVHHYGVTRNEAAVKGKCVGDNDPNENAIRAQDKVTPVITQSITPNPVTQGKKYKWLAEVKHPNGEQLSPEECAGQLTSGKARYGLKFNKKTGNCQHSKSLSSKDLKPGQQQFYVKFAGNKFMNAAESTVSFTVSAKTSSNDKKTGSTGGSAYKAKPVITAPTLTKTGPLTGQVSYTVTGVNCSDIKVSHKWKRYKDGKLVQTGTYKRGDGKRLALEGKLKVQAGTGSCAVTGSISASRSFTKSENKGNEIADYVTIKNGRSSASAETNRIGIGQ